ncbi:MAG: glycosyltransferase family 2 protein [Alphaproteobacteria bacterium]|nr:glycosyltransferase family 2 protein [Alphaproteobacteria bacterium]
MTMLSVVIPVRNGAAFLPRALASIRGEVTAEYEILVVDDGSTDDTAAVATALARDWPIRLIGCDKGSPSGARNAGVAAAAGDLLAFLDVDDEWMPGRMAELSRRIVADPALDVAYGKVEVIREEPDDPLWSQLFVVEGAAVFPLVGSGLYRRRAFSVVGPFDEALRFGEDTDWFLRACEAGLRMVIIDRPVLRYYLHRSNMTRNRAAAGLAIATVLRRSLDRRRSGGVVRPLPQPSDFFERADPAQ